MAANCQDTTDLLHRLKSVRNFTVLKDIMRVQNFNPLFTEEKKFKGGGHYYENRGAVQIKVTGVADTILSLTLTQWNISLSRTDTLINWIDSANAERKVQAHNTQFGSGFSIKDFVSSECNEFSTGCGMAGRPSKCVKLMLKLVDSLNRNELLAWAGSVNLQQRAHGTVGLSLLKCKGTALTSQEENVIKFNQGSCDLVEYCSGCTGDRVIPLCELVSEKNLKALYKQLYPHRK